MKYFIFVLSLFVIISAQAEVTGSERPLFIRPGSEFQIHLEPELLEKKEKIWTERSGRFGQECTLSIRSRFDAALAASVGTATYFIESVNDMQGQTSIGYRNLAVRDQFNFVLTTENKNLPLLMFECFLEMPLQSHPKWTVTSVERLIGQPGFFAKSVFSGSTQKTAAELAGTLKSARTLQPLHFSGKREGVGLTLNEPYLQNGKVFYDPKDMQRASSCSVGYHVEPDFGSLKDFDVTFPASENMSIDYFSEFRSGAMFRLRDQTGHILLEVSCYTKEESLQSFADIEKHLTGIIEIQR